VNIYTTKQDISDAIKALKNQKKRIGFVATMGALHQGHMALVNAALSQNDIAVVSVFVNPTQFNNQEDLDKYPRTLERDINLLKTVSKDKIVVFAPTVETIYNGNTKSEQFNFDGLELEMEGKFRQGHFNGVGTIVKRLLEIIKPDKAYFGEKDFQQLQIIKKLVKKHNIPSEIIGCPIHRELSGLAMSSRNERLKEVYKNEAPFIYKTLMTAKDKFGTESATKVVEWVTKQVANNKLLKLEYFIIADEQTLKPVKRKSNKKSYRAFIAVYADDIRLIDNIALN
jgi:pantoate--beta-alanine ligase